VQTTVLAQNLKKTKVLFFFVGSWKFLFLAIFCFAITFPWMTCMAEENIGSLFLKGNATAEP